MATYFSNTKERVLQYADYKGIAKEKFFEKIGVTYGNFKGKAKLKALSSDTVATIVALFPDINLEWLITGKGEMIKKNEPPPVVDSEELCKLKEENSRLKDKVIQLLEENTRLKDEAATKSNKHTSVRPTPGKLTS